MQLRKREERERLERELLAPEAMLSSATKGREVEEPLDEFRTVFERDRDRILHSKAFRRLKHKTQVFMNPDGDHFVTRLTHTLQVTQIGRAMAVTLGLNEPLTEAICLGHDVGHSPFGHTGEDALTPYVEGEWHHCRPERSDLQRPGTAQPDRARCSTASGHIRGRSIPHRRPPRAISAGSPIASPTSPTTLRTRCGPESSPSMNSPAGRSSGIRAANGSPR